MSIGGFDHGESRVGTGTYKVQLGGVLSHLLVLDESLVSIDEESFSSRSEVGTDLVAHTEVVLLRRDRSSQGSAKCINDWRISALGLSRLLEGLVHQSMSIRGQVREVLLPGHWVVTCSEEFLSDLTISVRLSVPTTRRVTLDTSNGSLHGASTLRGVHLLVDHHLLLHTRLVGVVTLRATLTRTEVHQSLNGLLALRRLRLKLVVRSIDQLSVSADELAKLGKINVHQVGLRE